MDYQHRITSNPDVLLGKPVIKGTRLTVTLLLRKLSEGASVEAIVQMYPQITKEDVFAALQYASEVIANEEILVPKASWF